MSHSFDVDFRCDSCDEIAATVCFVPKGEPHPRAEEFSDLLERVTIAEALNDFDRLTVTGFYASTIDRISARGADAVRTSLDARDPEQLYRINLLWAPFYCNDCKCSYCRKHWTTRDFFDDDPPGWYDRTVAKCPNGHERVISD